MANYAAIVTLDRPRTVKAHRYLKVISGKCDVTNYNQTGAEITDITKHFRKLDRVVCDGVSDNKYVFRWNTTDKCFHAFYSVYAAASSEAAGVNNTLVAKAGAVEISGSGSAFGQAGVEVVNDVDVGEVNFVAYGR